MPVGQKHVLDYAVSADRCSWASVWVCAIGGLVLGVVLFAATIVLEGRCDSRIQYFVVFPFDCAAMFALKCVASSSSGETIGVLLYLAAPLQFAVYGGALRLAYRYHSLKRTARWLLVTHVALAALTYCLFMIQ